MTTISDVKVVYVEESMKIPYFVFRDKKENVIYVIINQELFVEQGDYGVDTIVKLVSIFLQQEHFSLN